MIPVYRGDGDDNRQATVDWSWGTVKYRLGSSGEDDDNDDDNDDDDAHTLPVSSPQPSDVQPPSHTTELQVRQLTSARHYTTLHLENARSSKK